MIFRAIKFVAEAHEGHYRKGTKIPYISHLVNVMKTLAELNCEQEIVVAGLLHDVVEDTSISIDEVQQKFGDKVAEIVAGASEPEKIGDTFDENASWKKRKEHTINFVKNDAKIESLLVSCADKLDNARAIENDFKEIGDKIWERFNAPKNEQMWYYKSLSDAFAFRAKEFGNPLKIISDKLTASVCNIFG